MAQSKHPTQYVDVAPAIPLPASSPQTYTYQIAPDTTAELLTRVSIPFGKRTVPGVIVKVRRQPVRFPTKTLKLQAPWQLTAHQYTFAQWIARTMQGGFGYTLRLFFPTTATVNQQKQAVAALPTLPAAPARWAKQTLKQLTAKPGVLLEKDAAKRAQLFSQLAIHTAGQDQQTLILVPELWQLKLLEQQLAKQLGEAIAVVHSKLTPRQYSRIWQAVRDKQVHVIIGTQKAVYLPFQNLGLIVVDEESYDTHKLWDAYPRLDNRFAAKQLTHIHNAQLLYSGSFPSLARQHQLTAGTVEAIHDNPLIVKPRLIAATFADRRRNFLIPQELLTSIKQWQTAGQSTFILYNRRGTFSVATCTACHRAVRCPNCELALTVHGSGKKQQLVCHHCDHTEPLPKRCPNCTKDKIRPIIAGQEKIADIIQQQLPKTKVITLNADTINTVSSAKLQQQLQGNKPPLIIGTTAAFRLLGPLGIDRAVYLAPEQTLLYPDIRSSERAYTLLARLQQLLPAKRHVVIATRYRNLVEDKLIGTRDKLYTAQLKERQRLGYPPFHDLVRLTISGTTAAQALSKAKSVRQRLIAKAQKKELDIGLRGPFEAFQKRRRGRAEIHLLLLGDLDQLTSLYEQLPIDTVDVNPTRLL